MILELPPPEERKALLEEHAARFPERFDFTVTADNGKEDTVPLLLGNPLDDSAEWEQTVAATFKPRKFEADNNSLVTSCVLWPDPKTWNGIMKRWPGLAAGAVAKALRQKCGAALAALEEPRNGEEPPEAIKAALADPVVVWRRLNPNGATIDVALKPPGLTAWRVFETQFNKDDVKCWPMVRDMAGASIVASTVPADELFARWPGCATLVWLVVSSLAGVAAAYEKKAF